MKGYAENAVCPRCKTYTKQRIISRGVRECECGHQFQLRDTNRIQHGRIIRPNRPSISPQGA
jgi:hypothetical protein